MSEIKIIGDIDESLLDDTIEIGLSNNGRQATIWDNVRMPIRDLLTAVTNHEVGKKDGKALLQGKAINGVRKAVSMEFNDLVILDLDTGEQINTIIEKIRDLELFAVIWSTHSHMNDTTTINKDTLTRWLPDGQEPTEKWVRQYLIKEKRYQPWVLDQLEIIGTTHTEEGIVLKATHQPMPKFRVLFILQDSYVFAEEGSTQREAINNWKELYAGTAEMIGATYDRSCVDPSRLMYTPRHVDQCPHEVTIIAGNCLDIKEVKPVSILTKTEPTSNVFIEEGEKDQGSGGTDFKTPGLSKFLATQAQVFEAADWMISLDPDEVRREIPGGCEFLCPNDAEHSNPGDKEDHGFMVVNGTENVVNARFHMHCQHDGCMAKFQGDAGLILDLACQNYEIAHADELLPYCSELLEEGKPKGSSFDKLIDAAKNVPEGDLKGLSEICAIISTSDLNDFETELLVERLAHSTGIPKPTIKKGLKVEGGRQGGDEGTKDIKPEETIEYSLNLFNKEYAFAVVGSQQRILREPEKLGTRPGLMQVETFKNLESNNFAYKKVDEEWKRVNIFKEWMMWNKRRTYKYGVTFEPNAKPNGKYNMWAGFAIQPNQGDWNLLDDHIYDNICQKDDKLYHWLMTWMAQVIQQPATKMGSSLVLRGAKATGKSTLMRYFEKLFGIHAITVSQKSHIIGNFNAHQAGILLMVAEEAVWAGDREASGVLKHLITSETMTMEQKGIDPITMGNFARLCFISNSDWVVPASLKDERRFCVLDVGEEKQGDHDYFGAMEKQMTSGGLEGFMFDLMNWEPNDGDWEILRHPPVTQGLVEQAVHSSLPIENYFIQFAKEGYIDEDLNYDADEIVLHDDKPTLVPLKDIKGHYNSFLTRTGTNRRDVDNLTMLKDLCADYLNCEFPKTPRKVGGKSARVVIVPPRRELKEWYKAKFSIELEVADELQE